MERCSSGNMWYIISLTEGTHCKHGAINSQMRSQIQSTATLSHTAYRLWWSQETVLKTSDLSKQSRERPRYEPFRKSVFFIPWWLREIQCPFCPRFRQITMRTEIHRIYRHTLGLGLGRGVLSCSILTLLVSLTHKMSDKIKCVLHHWDFLWW